MLHVGAYNTFRKSARVILLLPRALEIRRNVVQAIRFVDRIRVLKLKVPRTLYNKHVYKTESIVCTLVIVSTFKNFHVRRITGGDHFFDERTNTTLATQQYRPISSKYKRYWRKHNLKNLRPYKM